jgi:hypothetical protein
MYFKLRIFYTFTPVSQSTFWGDHLQEAKICTKYIKHSKSCISFQLSGLTGLFWAEHCIVLKISAILLKYPTAFTSFHKPKNHKIRVSKHCIIGSKALINVKVRKRSIWALKHTIQGQNRLIKHHTIGCV